MKVICRKLQVVLHNLGSGSTIPVNRSSKYHIRSTLLVYQVDSTSLSGRLQIKVRSTLRGDHVGSNQVSSYCLEKKYGLRLTPNGGTIISCKGGVDTTINGVDTMAQSKGRNVKKRSTSVDTSPGQVDTTPSQVDTRDLSQGIDLPVWDSVSTHLKGRSTHSGISVT
ncbi:hypothetical protein Taro_001038 [Colocasia esculenta]|uniref:Uncharacterized protein n=1 Tax=Colocasia esculenta TaxID=4460 RepID=A0A843TGS2_COLES|nr:hypothetical protein [Colocasia esculenta]